MLKLFRKRLSKPIAEGYLPEEDGHRIYYAQYGNPNGETILSFHGAPGSSHPSNALRFDLKKYNVVLFDQRGCGKSTPAFETKNNNTEVLLNDAKRILAFLDIKGKIIASGASWGSTLALLFAEANPQMVKKIAVFNIYLASNEADEWFTNSCGNMYPELHAEFIKDTPKGRKSIYKHYYELISSSKKSNISKAMERFVKYEMSIGRLDTSSIDVNYDWKDANKTFLYYMSNRYFIKDNQILDDIKNIQNIPCLIVHNRLDILCPMKGAYDLHKALNKSKLIVKPILGHGCRIMPDLKKDIAEFLDN